METSLGTVETTELRTMEQVQELISSSSPSSAILRLICTSGYSSEFLLLETKQLSAENARLKIKHAELILRKQQMEKLEAQISELKTNFAKQFANGKHKANPRSSKDDADTIELLKKLLANEMQKRIETELALRRLMNCGKMPDEIVAMTKYIEEQLEIDEEELKVLEVQLEKKKQRLQICKKKFNPQNIATLLTSHSISVEETKAVVVTVSPRKHGMVDGQNGEHAKKFCKAICSSDPDPTSKLDDSDDD